MLLESHNLSAAVVRSERRMVTPEKGTHDGNHDLKAGPIASRGQVGSLEQWRRGHSFFAVSIRPTRGFRVRPKPREEKRPTSSRRPWIGSFCGRGKRRMSSDDASNPVLNIKRVGLV